MEETRYCRHCGKTKPLNRDNFYYDNSIAYYKGFVPTCIPCYKMAQSVRIPVRVKIITERGNKCETCGLYNEHPSFFDLDHVIPIKRGRGHRYYKMKTKDEVIVLCPNCHRLKTISEDGFKK